MRHYSFEKGLLGSFVSLDSISKSGDVSLQISDPMASYLRCGKDRVSVCLGSAAQYIEMDASTEKLVRWKVDLSRVVGGRANGFAVTEEGRIFVGIDNFSKDKRGRMDCTS